MIKKNSYFMYYELKSPETTITGFIYYKIHSLQQPTCIILVGTIKLYIFW